MKQLGILLLLMCCCAPLCAQDIALATVPSGPDAPAQEEALKHIKKGDEWLARGTEHFKEALPYFLKAQEIIPNDAELNFKIGKCYLLGSTERLRSLDYFLKARKHNPKVDPHLLYYLGQAYHLNMELDTALGTFKAYKKTIPPGTSFSKVQEVDRLMRQCETGKRMVKKPARVFIDNLGDAINSPYPEYDPVISADESVMLFTSRREGSTGGKTYSSLHEHYEDIYVSENVNGTWQPSVNIGKPINTSGHDATVGISPDGQQLLTYMGQDLYVSQLKGDDWSKPKKLSKSINTDFHESSACFSFDGKTLYFVSTRPDGSQGGRDIFKSEWSASQEEWGPAQNLGATVNTELDEESVFMHPDGKTLYFSSKGHNSIGGYDVFKSVYENGQWSQPENLGYPINSADDDVFFVVSASGEHGYYTSIKPDSYGEKDIYLITFLGPEKQVMLNTEDNLLAKGSAPVSEVVIEPAVTVSRHAVTLFKGIVTDEETGEPIEASIELVDNLKTAVVAEFNSNSATGKYLIALPAGNNYGIAVKADGYLFHSENFVIPEAAAYKEIRKNIQLQQIKAGKSIILKNIFFDIDKATLTEASTIELANAFELLDNNPSIKVEIAGHTDNTGSDAYNQRLSESRAKAVVDHLLKLGIKPGRLVYKGYGESEPAFGNETEAFRQLNRRTEFKVLED